MPFNHYAKIKRILETADPGWYVCRINKPTQSKTFKGETRYFEHYYRIYTSAGVPIPYCKFQQLELFAKTMGVDEQDIIILEG